MSQCNFIHAGLRNNYDTTCERRKKLPPVPHFRGQCDLHNCSKNPKRAEYVRLDNIKLCW